MVLYEDVFEKVLDEIRKYENERVPVPGLAGLLGVKATTLNARFRREKIKLFSKGRTSFVDYKTALELAKLHEYAIREYPTLKDAYELIGIKIGTIKDRCAKGIKGRKIDVRIDLTKKLRILPEEVVEIYKAVMDPLSRATFRRDRKINSKREEENLKTDDIKEYASKQKAETKIDFQTESKLEQTIKDIPIKPEEVVPAFGVETQQVKPDYTLQPAPEHKVKIITAKDYGLQEEKLSLSKKSQKSREIDKKEDAEEILKYDCNMPPSIPECVNGRLIIYLGRTGTIKRLLSRGEYEFRPMIKVDFESEIEGEKELTLVVRK